VIDPSFQIITLEGECGDCINQPKDWPNTKEGIDRFYQHWQRIEEESGNPLGGQNFVPVGRGVDLGTNAMSKIFHKQNQFLRTTKMKLVHNLG
jgi:hypothetical protein